MGWQKEAMKQAGMSGAELGRKMQAAFPGASKMTASVALRPRETGVTFTPSANKVIAALTGYSLTPKRETRKCPERIQCRITRRERTELLEAMKIMGHDTINDAVVCSLRWYIRTAQSAKKAAADPGTARDGTGKYPTYSIPSREAVVNVQT